MAFVGVGKMGLKDGGMAWVGASEILSPRGGMLFVLLILLRVVSPRYPAVLMCSSCMWGVNPEIIERAEASSR